MKLAAMLLIMALSTDAQGIITTIAGGEPSFPTPPVNAVDAPLGSVKGIAIGNDGSIWFADADQHRVFKLNRSGIITIAAGNGIAGFSGDGGSPSAASLSSPGGVAISSDGSLIIADSGNNRIRRVGSDGSITTIAGTGAQAFAGDGGPAVAAILASPTGVAADNNGNIYIADYLNIRVRRIDTQGMISTVAGNGFQGTTGDGGPAVLARLTSPIAVAIARDGSLLIADQQSGKIRSVSSDGRISTPFSTAGATSGIAIDRTGDVYATELSRIVRFTVSGEKIIIAGSEPGFADDSGTTSAALFSTPYAIAFDQNDNLIVADTGNERLRKITLDRKVETIAGSGSRHFGGDGQDGTLARLNAPYSIATGRDNRLLIADTRNHRIRQLAADGTIQSIAGTGESGFSGDGGPAPSARLDFPQGIFATGNGNILIADTDNNRVRMIDPAGIIRTLAGNGQIGAIHAGPSLATPLTRPVGVVSDAQNQYFLSHWMEVGRIDPAGQISTYAGQYANGGFSGDGGPALQGLFGRVAGIASDSGGNLYIADPLNHRVRKVGRDGTLSTLAGSGRAGYCGDGGPAIAACLSLPTGVAADGKGGLFIAEAGNHTVRWVSPAGVISTVAGTGQRGFAGDGGPGTTALLNTPTGVSVDQAGNVYVADQLNNRVRKILAVPPAVSVMPAAISVTAPYKAAATIRSITIKSSPPGMAYVATVSPSDTSWLSISPARGVTPSDTQVEIDTSSLDPGTYVATVSVSILGGITAETAITVVVSAPVSGNIVVENGPITFGVTQGASPEPTSLVIKNVGTSPVNARVTARTVNGGAWLQVNMETLTLRAAPVSVQVEADTHDLLPGTYSGTISVLVTGAPDPITIPVTLSISASQRSIVLSQTGLTFSVLAQGGTNLPQTFAVLNAGTGSMNWQTQITTSRGGSWLSVSPASGQVARPLLDFSEAAVQVNAQGLAPGEYRGTVKVLAPGADNSPQSVLVVLNVLPPGSTIPPEVRPTGLVFTAQAGSSSPGSQEIIISNPSGKSLTYASGRTFVDGMNWFEHRPLNDSVTSTRVSSIVVQPMTADLTPGIRRAVLTLAFSDDTIQPVRILTVVAPPPSSAVEKSLTRKAESCSATQLKIQVTQQPLSALVNNPIPIEAKLVDNCGAPVTRNANATLTPSDGPPIRMTHINAGRWSCSWLARAISPGPVSLVITAFTVFGTQVAGDQVAFTVPVTTRGGDTAILARAISSAAGSTTPGVVSPGALVSVYGSALGDGPAETVASLPLPTELGQVKVSIADRPVPVSYVSQMQINAQVPYDLPINTQHQIQIQRGTNLSLPEAIIIAAAQPAIFTVNQQGTGQGVIVNAQTNKIADSRNPVRAGDSISIYCTGLGNVSPTLPAGEAAPLDRTVRTTNVVEAKIADRTASVTFSGLAPGFAGVYQVNAVVPDGPYEAGDVPVYLTVAGQTSPAVSIAVTP